MQQPGRKYSAGSKYRYGFNGKENDNEVKVEGGQHDYGARVYDSRIGKFLSVDPLQAKYSDLSPYQFTVNNPIMFLDGDGKDTIRFTKTNVSYQMKGGSESMQGVVGGRTAYSISIIKSPSKDVFYYQVVNTVINANGISSTGKPVVKEFFPNETKTSSVTQSRCVDGCRLPGEVDDLGAVTLWKLASPKLVDYLVNHNPNLYGSLKRDRAMMKAGEVLMAFADAALLFEGGLVAKAEKQIVSPWEINFSQRTVSGNVDNYIADMKAGNWDWKKSGPIRVMKMDGNLVSYDNRRLLAAQRARVSDIPYEEVNPNAIMPGSKRTWEEAFKKRFNDPRNAQAGGAVPNGGVSTQPTVIR